MIDKFTLVPNAVQLAGHAVQKNRVPLGFVRAHRCAGDPPTESLWFDFKFGKYRLVRIRAFKTKDGKWWISWIESNIPALLAGHNAGLPTTEWEIALALTRLRFIVGIIATPDSLHGLVPLGDVGRGNRAYLSNAEVFWQFDDPCLRFLKASHLGRMKNQHKTNCVYWGESTRMYTRERRVSIYDKASQSNGGMVSENCATSVRFEVQYRCLTRFAKDAAAAISAGSKAGCVATLSPEGVRALLDLTQSRLLGFGWSVAPEDLAQLSKASRGIVAAAGKRLFDHHGVDAVLDAYRDAMGQSERTFGKADKEVRAWAVRHNLRRSFDPATPIHSLPPSPVSKPWVEDEFSSFMGSIDAPNVPDADILEAWSQTRILRSAPRDRDQLGTVAPFAPPFPRRGLT